MYTIFMYNYYSNLYYPLVNSHITMENHHFIAGSINYCDLGHVPVRKLLVYQRLIPIIFQNPYIINPYKSTINPYKSL